MPAWVVPAIMGVASLAANWFGNRRQEKKNKEFADYQASVQDNYMQKQLEYNTPKEQMARYQDAGLNPNLIYGQGNPGNQSEPQRYPDVKAPNYGDLGMANAMALYNQTSMAQSQVQANNASTLQKTAMTSVNRVQAQLLAANPLLNTEGFKAILDSLKMTAELKGTEWNMALSKLRVQQDTENDQIAQVSQIVDNLVSKFNLQSMDSKIKAEVLQGKEFQNAILEVQKQFMTNAEFTPQHIIQFIQILLMKLL